MANLVASGVTFVDTWLEKFPGGKEFKARQVEVVLSSMGTATNYIAASLFDMTKCYVVGPVVLSDNTVILLGSPSYDGSKILLKAAGSNAPADFSGTYRFVVKGN